MAENPVQEREIRCPTFRRRACAALAGATLVLSLSLARSEVTWMQPERFSATPGAILVMELTTAPEFAEPSSPVAGDRLLTVSGSLGDQPLMQTAPITSASMLQFAVTLPRPGVAVLMVDLKPERREITRDAVERYLRRIHATDDVRDAWAAAKNASVWRERRTTRLRSYVRVGEPSAGERPWLSPAASGLDLLSETDPTFVRENDQVPVRVLRDGKPVPGIIVAFLSRGENREHVVVTDANGHATAPVDAAGPWLIQCWNVRRSDGRDVDWNVDSVALTLEVR